MAPGTLTSGPKPTIKGKAKVGEKLKVKGASFSPGGAAMSYQWYVNGKAIKGADDASFKLTAKQKGKKVTVKVTATLTGYTPLTVATAPTGKVT